MSQKKFSPFERHAVWTVHGERCYMCTHQVDLKSMQVDHVVPESLIGTQELESVKTQLNLLSDFDINGFENWLPACAPCNRRKSNVVFKPSLLIQLQLQMLQNKKAEAEDVVAKAVSRRQLSLALNTLERVDPENLTEDDREVLRPLVEFTFNYPNRINSAEPVKLTPLYEVLSDDGHLRIARGPFGVGGGPSNPDSHMRCPSCGHAFFNGARCVICGTIDDD